MSLKVTFSPGASNDLVGIEWYIAGKAGAKIAEGYVERIVDSCLELADYPRRGRARDDLSPGLRTRGFERRVLIAYRVLEDRVEIERVFYGGQDYETFYKRRGR